MSASGVSQKTVSNVLRGDGSPTLSTIEAIADALHVHPAELITAPRPADTRKLIIGLFANESGDFTRAEIEEGRFEVTELRAGRLS